MLTFENQYSVVPFSITIWGKTTLPFTALFEQVLVNIIKNSVESITSDDGKIVIATSVDCGTVSIDVSDNGCGISTDAAQQLFTPFFTTKPQGKGLGLTLIREILTKHKCTYQLHTGTDKLTHFKIMF